MADYIHETTSEPCTHADVMTNGFLWVDVGKKYRFRRVSAVAK